MHGQIKLGRWRPFTARQVLTSPDGYIWAAMAWLADLPVIGYGRLGAGAEEMRWRLLRLNPVLNESGSHVTRSAYGRLAGGDRADPDRVPARVLSRGEYANTAVASWQFGIDTEPAELRVMWSGRLAEVRVNRWGNPGARRSAGIRSASGSRPSRGSAGPPFPRCSGPTGGGHGPVLRGRALPGRNHRRGFS